MNVKILFFNAICAIACCLGEFSSILKRLLSVTHSFLNVNGISKILKGKFYIYCIFLRLLVKEYFDLLLEYLIVIHFDVK